MPDDDFLNIRHCNMLANHISRLLTDCPNYADSSAYERNMTMFCKVVNKCIYEQRKRLKEITRIKKLRHVK